MFPKDRLAVNLLHLLGTKSSFCCCCRVHLETEVTHHHYYLLNFGKLAFTELNDPQEGSWREEQQQGRLTFENHALLLLKVCLNVEAWVAKFSSEKFFHSSIDRCCRTDSVSDVRRHHERRNRTEQELSTHDDDEDDSCSKEV